MLSSASMAPRRNKSAIFGPESVVRRVDALRRSEDEARWRVIERLLDEHDARFPPAAPEASVSPPSPARTGLGRILHLGGKNAPPRDQAAPQAGVPA